MIEGLRHIIYPEVCVTCSTLLEKGEESICPACLAGFEPFPGPFAGGEALRRVVSSHFGPDRTPASAWCLYPFGLGNGLEDAMHELKYGGVFRIGARIGRKLGELIAAGGGGPAMFDAVVPVPLHRLKEIERTYNQAAIIAEAVAAVIGVPVVRRAIVRKRYTETQTGFGVKEREANMTGVFETGTAACPGRVLLVDDVLTTGATMVSAAGALLAAGARSVAFATVGLTEKT